MLLDSERLDEVRIRLKKAISELEQTVDENRFEQELIYYLEKLDITEEKVRLKNHLSYFLYICVLQRYNYVALYFFYRQNRRI
mgnify:CR=1 FL=1